MLSWDSVSSPLS